MSEQKGPNPEFDENIPRCSGQECLLFDTLQCGGQIGAVCEPVIKAMLPEDVGSALIITFAGPGSAEFAMKPVGMVSGGQLAALGQSLISRADFLAKNQMYEMMSRRQGGSRILVPGMDPRMVEGMILRGEEPS